MERWVENLRVRAEVATQPVHVREVLFSGATYQVEVYDAETEKIYWPFLQFDEEARVKDAFCSCSMEQEKCPHLLVAYVHIVDDHGTPLHIRFEKSFWHHICRLFAEHSGYEERFLQVVGAGHYLFRNDIFFEFKTTTADATHYLAKMMESRSKETPENSIKFSNLDLDEIARWKAGRPSPFLRYALSFWSDLAKWCFAHHEEGELLFQEDEEGFPTRFEIHFPFLRAHVGIKKEELSKLIPYLDSVKSNLKLFLSSAQISSLTFDPQEPAFYLKHSTLRLENFPGGKKEIGEWNYLSKIGFYPVANQPLLQYEKIGKEHLVEFLNHYSDQIAQFLPVRAKLQTLKYFMFFDEEWNWHFEAYLMAIGELSQANSLFLKEWVFIKDKGFYRVEGALFESAKVMLPPHLVSDFVNTHRIWLNAQEGFTTHLSSMDGQISYTLSKEWSIHFHSQREAIITSTKDFGDWIFYKGLGFFSKKQPRMGWRIHPGLVVKSEAIASFIKNNQEELETIPHFFTPVFPLTSLKLHLTLTADNSVKIEPHYTILPEFEGSQIHFFSDYLYLENQGFIQIPTEMRIPSKYTKAQTIPHSHLSHFVEHDLPLLKNHLLVQNRAIQSPHKIQLCLSHLSRLDGGLLKTELFYQTEYGRIDIADLMEAVEHKRRFCFTDAGLIDLHLEPFQWLRGRKFHFNPEERAIELSPMEFIRLDAMQGLLTPHEEPSTAALLQELREFTSHQNLNIQGLKSELRLYQQTGLSWLWFLYTNGLSGLLCDDMGLGKTHQAMALIAAASQQSTPEKQILIVCPTSVIFHWQDKLKTFLPHLKVYTFHGLKRTLKKMPKKGIILTSYGILRIEQEKLEQIPFEVAIFDEIQIAKNARSRIHEALKKIKAKIRIGLTGTPIENSLKELKSLLDIVLPGYMPSESRFREFFILPIERDQNEEKKALLTQMIKPFVLRRKKSEVLTELPEKIEDKSYCHLSDEQTLLYKQALAQSQQNLVNGLQDQHNPINYIHIFSLLSRLKQICDHPALFYKDPKNFRKYESGKWELFVELLEEARESNQKVVIFSQYLHMLDIFAHYLKEKKWGYAQIRGDTLDRAEQLQRFTHDPNCIVFIGSLQAAGLGIDLTAANVLIMYDRWWNAARENQAIDRVHRIGQTRGVQVYKLITKNTIEEKIDQMIIRKGRLLDDVVISDDQALIKKFTRSELIELLSFDESPE